jgi:tetratricopeptide (TPR) repeat protein
MPDRRAAAASRGRVLRLACAALVALGGAGCAARMPAVPASLAHPEFVHPAVPASLRAGSAARDHERGWRYLQADNLERAAEAFSQALRRVPSFHPSMAGQGYVALASGRLEDALEAFDKALARDPAYAPALAGRGHALLALDRADAAADAFEAAVTADPALSDLNGRVAVLRLRSIQTRIARAREAAAAGRLAEARAAYQSAIEASPESAFLHRELAQVEVRRGAADAALEHLRKAADLDPDDAAARVEIGTLLEARDDFDGALGSYREAYELQPDPELAERITAVRARARDARLPAEFRAIASASQLTRGELAALIGVRFEPLLGTAPSRSVVLTDIRGHWAAEWIQRVVEAGVMDAFENHTFQPGLVVRRSDLAAVARRIALLEDSSRPGLGLRQANRPGIADVSPSHLSYPAVSFVVASGLMPLADGSRFQPSRAVTGAEAVDLVDRLRSPSPTR